jgi:nucleoside-triphosphatase THEP1
MSRRVFILTGRRGSGKTTLCRRLAERKTAEGWLVSGLLSLARMEGEEKTGIETLDLRTGESRLLASLNPCKQAGFRFGQWVFDPKALAWGNQVLERSIPTDLLIIDEIGPLEFNLAAGWTMAFDVLARNRFCAALVVVRPECLEDAQKRLEYEKIIRVNLSNSNLLELITKSI